MKSCLVWFRNDLRLSDNLALNAAALEGYQIIPVYIFHEGKSGQLNVGGASKWWLHHALEDLTEQVEALGGALIITRCEKDPVDELMQLAREYQVDAVFWNRRYEPEAIEIDSRAKESLRSQGYEVKSFIGNIINEPHTIENKSGKPFQVFTPYWKRCRQTPVTTPVSESFVFAKSSRSSKLSDLELLPQIGWDKSFYELWEPTRLGAEARLQLLVDGSAERYTEDRDLPAVDGTSCLSSWLHFGQISVREIYQVIESKGEVVHLGYLRQLYWRDFAHHLMFHFPHSVTSSLRKEYELFPWEPDEETAERWRRGKTGYPIIDAGMRQLWQTGWMHNRVRMIVASFLVKHLLQDWRVGLEWFDDTLVDADLANNVMGWQWCAGSGADAAPYFRIFNPVTQGEKFDPDGEYVKKYIPELANLPKRFIHKPWEMNALEQKEYGVDLGTDFPHPVVELKEGREKALAAFQTFKLLVKKD